MDIELEVDPIFTAKRVCDITRDLDHASKINVSGDELFHHYMQYDKTDLENHVVIVRVPGGTLGYVKFDDDLVITEINIDTDYVVKTYSGNVNKILNKKYKGSRSVLLPL